jgi:hypothetical protein
MAPGNIETDRRAQSGHRRKIGSTPAGKVRIGQLATHCMTQPEEPGRTIGLPDAVDRRGYVLLDDIIKIKGDLGSGGSRFRITTVAEQVDLESMRLKGPRQ